MKSSHRRELWLVAVLCALVNSCGTGRTGDKPANVGDRPANAGDKPANAGGRTFPYSLKVPDSAQVIGGASGVPRFGEAAPDGSKLAASTEVPRGATSAKLYPQVAPSVVLVTIPAASGTGFLVDGENWVVTN